MARRKNKKFIDPRYFMDEKMERLDKAHDTGQGDAPTKKEGGEDLYEVEEQKPEIKNQIEAHLHCHKKHSDAGSDNPNSDYNKCMSELGY